MKRGRLIAGSAVAAIAVFGVYLLASREGRPFDVESRVVTRERSFKLQETTIHKLPFPEFVTRLRNQFPKWRVGFRDQTVTFTSPDGSSTILASPGTYNPEPGWTVLGSSEEWSTVIIIRPVSWTDWFRRQVKPTGTMVVDIPLLYWGKPDKHGFALKLDKLPPWLSQIYETRTGSKVGTR